MKKYLLTIFGIISLILLSTSVYAASGVRSQSFRIQVVLPAIVGVNVPAENQEDADSLNIFTNDNTELVTHSEEVVRNNRLVTLRTIVAK